MNNNYKTILKDFFIAYTVSYVFESHIRETAFTWFHKKISSEYHECNTIALYKIKY